MAKLIPGENDLAALFPEIAKQANGWDPITVTAKSSKKLSWKCNKGHTWDATVAHRTNGRGCPFCANKKVWFGFNDLKTKFPEISAEAVGWDPSTVHPGSAKILRWECKKGHQWSTSPNVRTRGYGCPVCSNKKISTDNCLAAHFPELSKEWHFSKNHNLTPHDVTPGSSKKVWWQCSKSKEHTWEAKVAARAKEHKGCPFCSGRRVSSENSLAHLFPEIALEWHPIKNGALTPKDVTSSSMKKVWWQCTKNKTHEWEAFIGARQKGHGCPFCLKSQQQLRHGHGSTF